MEKSHRTITPFRVFILLLVLVGVYFLLPQLGSFKDTIIVLRHAFWPWIIIGLIASLLTCFAGAIVQFAAGNLSGRFSSITQLQFAGSFVNHFLPFSVGVIHLNSRYYQKLGKQRLHAITISTIPIIFEISITVILVAIISPISIIQLLNNLHPKHFNMWLMIPIVAFLITIILAIVKYRNRFKKLITEFLTAVQAIKGSQQLFLLVSGSVAIAILSTLALFLSILAVHTSIPITAVFIIFVTSQLVSEIVPTPGGIGATEAVLILALVAASLSLSEAVAAVLIYRLVMFWLPMIPGGLALHRVNSQKIL
jgi:undecaprenyl-diphosphatase